jgi:hypothetical protein
MVRQRGDGVNLAVLFNQRTDPSGRDYHRIKDDLDRAVDRVRKWPAPPRGRP